MKYVNFKFEMFLCIMLGKSPTLYIFLRNFNQNQVVDVINAFCIKNCIILQTFIIVK